MTPKFKTPKHAERNKQIIIDFPNMPEEELVKKYNIQFDYIRAIARQYNSILGQHDRREKAKEKRAKASVTGLYAERDEAIKAFMKTQGRSGLKVSSGEDTIRTNKGYTRRS